jgi:hypothetical protein
MSVGLAELPAIWVEEKTAAVADGAIGPACVVALAVFDAAEEPAAVPSTEFSTAVT